MKTIEAKNGQTLDISEKQENILVGCVLGDAYVSKRGKVQIEHSLKQREYIRWKYKELKSISYGVPSKVCRPDKRYGKSYISYRFWTRQFFKGWRKRFYPSGKKVFPKKIDKIPNISLAVWYMDDGYLLNGCRMMFATDGFGERSLKRIYELFQDQFNIGITIKGRGSILIGTRNTRRLLPSIRDYIIPSMSYKIP